MKLRRSCGNCRFYEARGRIGDLGLCVRNAPQPRSDDGFYSRNAASWLYVPARAWCGQWRRAGLFYRGVLRFVYNRWVRDVDGGWRMHAPRALVELVRFQNVCDVEAELRRVEMLYRRKRAAVRMPWLARFRWWR